MSLHFLLSYCYVRFPSRTFVQAEGTNFQKVIKLIELVPTLNDPKTMTKICTILEQDYDWLADELRAELSAERRQLKIEDYVMQEAATLVYRQFGGSRRLAQHEKKDIEMLVASRTQCAKEVSTCSPSVAHSALKRSVHARHQSHTVR